RARHYNSQHSRRSPGKQKECSMSSATVSEQQILESLRRLPREHWDKVLRFLDLCKDQAEASPTTNGGAPSVQELAATTWTAEALQRWPRPLQDAILHEQSARLIAEHTTNPEAGEVTWW